MVIQAGLVLSMLNAFVDLVLFVVCVVNSEFLDDLLESVVIFIFGSELG